MRCGECILDGVILDEAADMSPRLFSEVIRPALADRQGWAFWIGTPKGQNDFYDLVYGVKGGFEGAIASPDWFYLCLKASETGILPRQENLESAQPLRDVAGAVCPGVRVLVPGGDHGRLLRA